MVIISNCKEYSLKEIKIIKEKLDAQVECEILYLPSDVDGLTEEKAEKLVKKFLAISHCAMHQVK
jgi:hypothetical protein